MADKGPSAFDPADLFRDDPEAGKGFAKNIEDFFGDPPGGPSPKRAEEGARASDHGRGGMSEEEWRASPQYEEFRKKVIARHLQKKTEDEARAKAVQASPAPGPAAVPAAGPTDEERKQELLEKYKAAKAATIAQRKATVPPPPPPSPPLPVLAPQLEKAPAPPSPPPKKEPPPLPPLKSLPPSAFSPLPPLRPLPPLPSVPPKEKGNG